jgi:hypothetical protein
MTPIMKCDLTHGSMILMFGRDMHRVCRWMVESEGPDMITCSFRRVKVEVEV